jgi:hypothetical protein
MKSESASEVVCYPIANTETVPISSGYPKTRSQLVVDTMRNWNVYVILECVLIVEPQNMVGSRYMLRCAGVEGVTNVGEGVTNVGGNVRQWAVMWAGAGRQWAAVGVGN